MLNTDQLWDHTVTSIDTMHAVALNVAHSESFASPICNRIENVPHGQPELVA